VYRTRLLRKTNDYEIDSVVTELPISTYEQERLSILHPGCYIDVCRIVDDPLSDTANFRDEVYFDLEEA